MSTAPKFDRSRPFGEITHGTTLDAEGKPLDVTLLPRYVQDGHYFKPDGSYHSSDKKPPRKEAPAPVPAEQQQTLPAIDPAEAPELLKDPKAQRLLELPRDELIALVKAANGPVIAGDGSTELMVAWIVKNTAPEAPDSEL